MRLIPFPLRLPQICRAVLHFFCAPAVRTNTSPRQKPLAAVWGTFIGSAGGWCFQTTFKPHPVPWLEGCQATSGAHCSWRRTAQGDGVSGGRWGGMGGGILARRTKPRELFTLSDKFLLPHSWGAVTRITRFECHMSVIGGVCSAFFFSLVTEEICLKISLFVF